MARSLVHPFRRRPVPVRRCRTSCPRAPARWSRPARPGRIRTRHPAGRRPLPAVVRQLDEHRLPELIVAAVARDSHMSRPRPAASRIRLAQARRPAHLRRAGPLHPRTGALRLVFEQGSGYLNDQALTSRNESMITATHAVAAPQTSLRYQLAAETISPFSPARQQACQVATATSEPLPIDSTAALKARQTDRMPARP